VGAQREPAPACLAAGAWRPPGRSARAPQGLPRRHDRVRRGIGAWRPGAELHDLAGVPGPAGGGRRADAAEHGGDRELGLRPLGRGPRPGPHGRVGRGGRCARPHDRRRPDRGAELAGGAAGERPPGRDHGRHDAPRRAKRPATPAGGPRRSARCGDAGPGPLRLGPGAGAVAGLGLGVTAGPRGAADQRRGGRRVRLDRAQVTQPAAELRPVAPSSELPGGHHQPAHRRDRRDGAGAAVPAAADPEPADVSRPGRPCAAANDAAHGDHRPAGRALVRQDRRPLAAGHRVRGADPVRCAAGPRHRFQLVPGDPAGPARVRGRPGAGPDRQRPGVAGHHPFSRPGAGIGRVRHRRAVRRRDRDRHPLPAVPRGLPQGPGGQRWQQCDGRAADQAQECAAGGRADRAAPKQLPVRPREVPDTSPYRIGSWLCDRVPGRQRGRPDSPRRHGGHGPACRRKFRRD
jgi:hypothetical protein